MNYPIFKTAEDYQEYIRNGGTVLDAVEVEGTVFTQDKYDLEGHVISYGNKRKGLGMDIETVNRYITKQDALVIIVQTNCFREGFNYID